MFKTVLSSLSKALQLVAVFFIAAGTGDAQSVAGAPESSLRELGGSSLPAPDNSPREECGAEGAFGDLHAEVVPFDSPAAPSGTNETEARQTPAQPEAKGKQCTILSYQEFSQCEEVVQQPGETTSAFKARCEGQLVSEGPGLPLVYPNECLARTSSFFGTTIGSTCQPFRRVNMEFVASILSYANLCTDFPALCEQKDTTPILVKRGTSWDDVLKLLKAASCASPVTIIYDGHDRPLKNLKERCLASRELGISVSKDLGCRTFGDRDAMLSCMREIQKELKPGEPPLYIYGQQCTSSSRTAYGKDDSAVRCYLSPGTDAIVCRPNWCFLGTSCRAATDTEKGEHPALCTVYGGTGPDGKPIPNSLGCKKCVPDGTFPSGEPKFKWADAGLAACGNIPPEFQPMI